MGLSDNLRTIEAEIAAGHSEQALKLCLDLQTRYPRALAVQRVLGEAYLALRKPREALGALDRALAGNPEDARACCARAIVQQIHGDAVSALKWYRRACDLTPDDQVLRAAYRELATSQGQPAYRPTRLGLARIYMRGDLLSHAIREWEMLLYEAPDALEAQVGLAETLWRSRHFQAAADHCERILINAPACVKALLILAVIAHDEGRFEDAQRLARRTTDLDPDCRIGQALFADRLAGGDSALRLLLLGEEAAQRESVASRPVNSTSRPIRQATPSAPMQSPVGTRPSLPSQPLPEPAVLRQPPVPSQPLANGAGANFRGIFAETEYMLWGRDGDSSETPRIPPQVANTRQPAPKPPAQSSPLGQMTGGPTEDQFARSNVFVPPVLRDQGAGLDETEARSSINFVNWLQAQGAVQHDAATGPMTPLPNGSSAPLPPLPQSSGPMGQARHTWQTGQMPTMGGQQPPSIERLAVDWGTPTAEYPLPQQVAPSEPLPPPKPEDLRKMFAELEPETGAQRVVEGGIVEVGASSSTAANATREAPSSSPAIVDWEPMAGDHGGIRAEQTGDTAEGATTLEQLEQQLGGAGFQQVNLGTDAAASAASREPEMLAPKEEAEPANDAARLARARQRRSDDEVDGALADYRLILKNAPDLLNDVMNDLNEALDDLPDHPEVHRLLGDAHIRQGNYLQALESYNRAVALTQAQNN